MESHMVTAAQPYIWGTGRRKTAVARVRIREGTGKFVVNDLDVEAYFPLEIQRSDVRAPLTATEMAGRVDVFVNVQGSGKHSQSGAVLLGLAMTVVLGAANAYLGLRAGQTIAATYPAAVIGMAVLRLGKGSIL